ncbi:MAG: DUF1801 domain-containing protein, partial [Nitrososphaerales archaeon]
SELIDEYIADLTDWRGKTISEIRKAIRDTDPEIIEEWKWMGTPTWSHNGVIAIANAHKDKVKMTFPQGAILPDPSKIFNNGFKGNYWRAIDLFESDKINVPALRKLVQAAIALNNLKTKGTTKTKPVAKNKSTRKRA